MGGCASPQPHPNGPKVMEGNFWGSPEIHLPKAKSLHCVCTACALRGHCVHTAHAEAGILTQEYLSPDWLHSEAAKPT